MTFPNGDREGYLSVTPVNASKIPMAPPNGMQPQLIVTIQPTGARFDPPAPLQLPNVDGHAPGAQVEMYSFNHDLEEFVFCKIRNADGSIVPDTAKEHTLVPPTECSFCRGGTAVDDDLKRDSMGMTTGRACGNCTGVWFDAFIRDCHRMRICRLDAAANCKSSAERCGFLDQFSAPGAGPAVAGSGA